VQLVQVPSQLLELHVQELADPAAGLQRGDDPQPPEPWSEDAPVLAAVAAASVDGRVAT
jgi:hypothetical protein